MSSLTREEIEALAGALEGQPPEAILAAVAPHFPGGIALANSFGAEDCLLVDVIARAELPIRVFTLDTGYLFPETYALWKQLEQRYHLVIEAKRTNLPPVDPAATPDRANARVVEWDGRFGLVKVNPLAAWTSAEVGDRLRRLAVPTNPLFERGYLSIGCAPCTTPVKPGEDPRAGRWRGREKTECGLHVDRITGRSGA